MQEIKSFVEDYMDTVALIEANSEYGRIPSGEKKYMTVPEMRKLLGVKKTESYWLLHRHYFEWEEILGTYRINIASFEKWYANQVKHKKVTGEEPGKELKDWSLSPQEAAEILGISNHTIYELMRKGCFEIVIVDYWKRITKDSFYKWYNNQDKYRTVEDRERNAAIENATITMPEMARLLGVTRGVVYHILKNPEYKDIFETVIVAERKKITKESFEKFLESQSKYSLDKINEYEEIAMEENCALADFRRKKLKNNKHRADNGNLRYLTYPEAAVLAKVSRPTIYDWADKGCFPVIHVMNTARIPRKEFEQYLEKRKLEEGDEKNGINKRKKR